MLVYKLVKLALGNEINDLFENWLTDKVILCTFIHSCVFWVANQKYNNGGGITTALFLKFSRLVVLNYVKIYFENSLHFILFV